MKINKVNRTKSCKSRPEESQASVKNGTEDNGNVVTVIHNKPNASMSEDVTVTERQAWRV